MRLWYCTGCGVVLFRESEPSGCAMCGAEDFDTVEMGGGDVPDAVEECPTCGEFVPEGEVTHELGGAFCPECED